MGVQHTAPVPPPPLTMPKTHLLTFPGRTTGGSRTATSCPTGEAVAAIQGWARRAGTPTSLRCTHSPEATRCRAGGVFQPADRKACLLCDMKCWLVLVCFRGFDMFACQVGDGGSRPASSRTSHPEEL